MRITEIITDETMRELRMHGTPAFPFEYYYDDIHEYDRHYVEWHWHTEFEWAFVESGTIDCLIGSKRIRLRTGEGIFINSKVIHRIESKDGALVPNILFMPEFLAVRTSAVYEECILPVLGSGCPYYVFKKGQKREEVILQKLCDVLARAAVKEPSKIEILIAVQILWREFMRIPLCNDENTGKSMLLESRIRSMMQFIAEHYRERITLDEIALSANISKSEALRCFHEGLQSTPVKYLIDYRLNRAKELLLSTDDSVTEIAAEVGIGNVSYFIRIFTKEFGVTPRRFRKQCGEE